MKNITILGFAVLLAGCVPSFDDTARQATRIAASSSAQTVLSSGVSSESPDFAYPITRAQNRVTKKPFGIEVTPSSSPVSPERFTGYHTGEDFETFPDEQATDVPISAICTGAVRFTGWVKGYGGVLIQQCAYLNQMVTVLYGHLNIDSVSLRKDADLKAGEHIGMLGKGYSTQTDGERKHLHLAVHEGAALDFRGYVATAKELDPWINPFPFNN